MNAVALKAELELSAYLRGLTWPSGVDVAVVESYSRGAQSAEDPEMTDQMPAFPRVVVRCSDSSAVDNDVDVHECSLDVELQTSADDEEMLEMFNLLQVMDAGIQSLTYNDGWENLNQAVDGSTPGFDCQFALPGAYSGSGTNNRARTFSRAITLFCRVVMP